MLIAPDNIFCLIERAITAHPHLLNVGDYHTLPSGEEALTPQQIVMANTAHDLAGWVVRFTDGAPKVEGMDTLDLANAILVASGRAKLPHFIEFGEPEDCRKLVSGRAAEERALNGD